LRLEKVSRNQVSEHGGARPGAGRKQGGVNRATAEAIEAAKEGGELPLDFLLRIMRDTGADEAKRIDCAKAAAPYLHAKLNAIDHSASDGTMGEAIKGALAWKPPQ
jgi:hypothetical protein